MKKRSKKRRYEKARLRWTLAMLKVVGIVAVSSALGLSVLGSERYSAIFSGMGSAIASEVLPGFNLSAAAESEASSVQRVHQLSMSVVGGRSTIPALAQYQRVEMELLAKGAEPSVMLRLQEKGRNQPIQEYERAVSEAYFSQVWQQLRDLETAQLTNLSPYTEQITANEFGNKSDSLSLVAKTTASATYRFQFKDGLHDYPNSFEVHAPEQLKDTRYKGVRDLAFTVLADSFGDVLSQP